MNRSVVHQFYGQRCGKCSFAECGLGRVLQALHRLQESGNG
ncbi:MAG: hypothetical protein ACI9BC_002436 [Crocinitomicaceae bacterium]|jgi:hypothetical protein